MRRIFISFFLSILLLKYASSDSDCQAKTTLDAEETCAQLGASEDHYCTDNDEQDATHPCKEEDACNLLEPDKSTGCAGYTTHNKDYHCKEITVGSEQKCKEVPACQGATPDTISYENCKDLWVDDTNKNKCVAKQDNSACTVATNCEDVKIEATPELCNFFSTDKEKCVVDGNKCKQKTICGQETYVKGTTKCRDSEPDANKVCADTGSGCESQTPCGEVTYQVGTDCSILPTVDPDKICRKHKTEQRCEEVTQPDNEGETGANPSEETGTNPGTKASEETGTNPSEETGTNPSEETGTNPGTKPNGETSPTQGTETDLSKDNKGMLLNLSLYTLLIYFLF